MRSIRRALDCKGCSADCAGGGGRGGEGVGERGMIGEAGGVVRGVDVAYDSCFARGRRGGGIQLVSASSVHC